MIWPKKMLLVIILVTSFVLTPIFAGEPNEPNNVKTGLHFEMSNVQMAWQVGMGQGMGPIKPEYAAELFIKDYGNLPGGRDNGKFEDILQTKIGKSMSARQQEFIKTSSSFFRINQQFEDKPIGSIEFRLYAVSQEDARKMAQAFIELLNERAQERIKGYNDILKRGEQKLTQAKKDLPEKESELKEMEKKYQDIKEKTHPISSDAEAVELAKKSIAEMDKTLNSLKIDEASITVRLQTIDQYRDNPESTRPEVITKLDVMYVELMVELRGLEAKKAATEKINALEQNFVSTFNKRNDLLSEISQLNETINSGQDDIVNMRYRLNNPTSSMNPPEIYQNLITIYPIVVRKNN